MGRPSWAALESWARGSLPGPWGLGRRLTGPRALQSLVLLSRLPFVRLFQALLGLVAPEFFDKLVPCLEAGEWPAGAVGPLRLPGCSSRRLRWAACSRPGL